MFFKLVVVLCGGTGVTTAQHYSTVNTNTIVNTNLVLVSGSECDMNNLDRLKLVVSEHRPWDNVIETEDNYVVLDPNGLHIKTDKSDTNVQWTIDLLTGQDPWARNRGE